MPFFRDLKVALRSLARTKGLAITVILTLALGIGANAAIFTPGARRAAAAAGQPRRGPPDLHPPERARHRRRQHHVLRARDPGPASARQNPERVRRLLHHRLHHGRPRRAARSARRRGRRIYFDVMGLHPVLGRLLGPHDDGPSAAGASCSPIASGPRAQKRSLRARQNRPARQHRRSLRHHRRRAGTVACPIRPKPRSSPTSSPARIISRPPWSPAASIA